MNLLTETLDCMKELGKTPDDVLYVRMTKDSGFLCDIIEPDASIPDEIRVSFKDFAEVADKEYDSGYGSNEVNRSLAILFDDNTILCRWEYDGAEGWTCMSLPRTHSDKHDKELIGKFLWGREINDE